MRGFRADHFVYDVIYTDTQSVYRIPIDPNASPDFTTAGSYWLEFPDPYMAVIRNPTVGDTFNRYYFFPSDEYASAGVNPAWPVVFTAFSSVQYFGSHYCGRSIRLIRWVSMPLPAGPPTVTPPPLQVILPTTAAP